MNTFMVMEYGMLWLFSGQWPEPQVGQIRAEPGGRMIPVSEAERREVFFRAIGNDHPLVDLIHKCIDNYPQSRAHVSEIVERLAEMVLQFPASFANRLEMLRQTDEDEEEKSALAEEGERKDEVFVELGNDILACKDEIQALTEEGERKDSVIKEMTEEGERKDCVIQQKESQIERLKLAHSSEVECFQLQIKDLNTQNQLTTTKMEAEIAELKSNAAIYESQIETSSRTQLQEREQFEQMIAKEREQSELQLQKVKEQSEFQLAQEREVNKKLMADLQSHFSKLMSENTQLQSTISELQANISEKDSAIQMNDTAAKRKDCELEAKSRALEEKDATISAMCEQITKTREYLTTSKQQVRK